MKRVAVRMAWTEAEAQIVAWRLQGAGIDATIDGGALAAAAFDVALAERGGVKVLVPEDQVDRANAELKTFGTDAARTATESDANDEDEPYEELPDDEPLDARAALRDEREFEVKRLRSRRFWATVIGGWAVYIAIGLAVIILVSFFVMLWTAKRG